MIMNVLLCYGIVTYVQYHKKLVRYDTTVGSVCIAYCIYYLQFVLYVVHVQCRTVQYAISKQYEIRTVQ